MADLNASDIRAVPQGPWGEPWLAPAKLNLLLRIVGRRDDGYHLLQTVFQFLDAADTLYFNVRADGLVHRSQPVEGVPEAEDLSLRAAQLLKETSRSPLGVDIRLVKRLPIGGGLGGGSSDAATTLVALNRLWDLGLALEDLAELGVRLGADVPVFVRGQSAWAEGVGEKLTPLALEQPWYVVLIPSVHVSTKAVFSDPELTRDSPRITIRDFLAGADGNDCEAVVRSRYPEVDLALSWLGQFGEARLTGTGACVFASFEQEQEARTTQAQVPSGWRSLVARGLNRSPLLTTLPHEVR